MYKPTKEEFIELAKEGNLIPVYKEIVADLETPVSTFMRIKDSRYSYLLESVEGGEKIARYSFMGSEPALIFKSKDDRIEILRDGKEMTFRTPLDPLREIKKLLEQFKFVKTEGLPRFCGGLVGYMSYDVVRFFEDIPDKNPDDLKLPDTLFILADNMLIFDHVDHTIKIVYNVGLKEGAGRDQLERL